MKYLDQEIGIVATRPAITVNPDDSIGYVLLEMIKNRFRRFPVVDDKNQLVGIISGTDILRMLNSSKTKKFLEIPISDCYSSDVISMNGSDDLGPTLGVMMREDVSCVPVIYEDGDIGMFTNKDILLLHYLWRELEDIEIDEDKGPGVLIDQVQIIDNTVPFIDVISKILQTDLKQILVQNEKGDISGFVTIKRILKSISTFLISEGYSKKFLEDKDIKSIVLEPLLIRERYINLSNLRNWMNARGVEAVPIVDENNNLIKLVTERHMRNHLIENLNLNA